MPLMIPELTQKRTEVGSLYRNQCSQAAKMKIKFVTDLQV